MKLRFAPSPSGLLHIANARVAIVNYLEAAQNDAELILRIENTDVLRSTDENERRILEDLRWLGIRFDEFYRQQDHLNLYKSFAESLIKKHKAYRCFCGKQQLQEQKQIAVKTGVAYRYPGHCADIPDNESNKRAENETYTIRLRISGRVTVDDFHRGKIKFSADDFDDFIIIREDGRATYNFACAIDDLEMKIDEVIRGEDHITNTARQIIVFNALDKQPPKYIHLPTMLDPDRKKISKRKGGYSISELRESGIFPEAIILYLASMGTGKEFKLEDLPKRFSIKMISKSNPVFDFHKLSLINESLMKTVDESLLLKHLIAFEGNTLDADRLRFVSIFRNNAKNLVDLRQQIDRFIEFHPRKASDEDKKIIRGFIRLFEKNSFAESVKKLSAEVNKKGKAIYHPIRIALTGSEKGPSIAEIIEVFGKKNTISRLSEAL